MSEGLSQIEQHIVQLIEFNLRSRELDASRAKAIAQAVLLHLKSEMTEFQLFQAAESLSKNFPELTGIAAEAEEQYEQRIRDVVVSHASNLLKQGDVIAANALLANALSKDQEIRIDG